MSTLFTHLTRAVAAAAALGGFVIGLAAPAAAAPAVAAPTAVAAAVAAPAAVAPAAAAPAAAAPAPAAPPAAGETRESCAAPAEGVQLCEVYTDVIPGQSSGKVHAELRTDAGVTIQAGLLTVDACSASCNSFRTAVGKDVTTLVSDSLPVGKGTGYYQVTGTWVVANHQHTGRV